MKYALLALLAFITGCSGCVSIPTQGASRAAVRMQFEDGVCSATAVGNYTLLSAGHCFADRQSGVMKVNGEAAAFVVVANDGKDHVLIHVTARQRFVARIGPKPKRGQMLTLIGNPMGFYGLLRMGRVAGWDEDAKCADGSNGCTMMFANLETAGGDSGGGYFNGRGEVVGVHTGTVTYMAWSLAYSYPLAFAPSDYAKIQ